MKRKYEVTAEAVYTEYVDIRPMDAASIPRRYLPKGCEYKVYPMDTPVCGVYRAWL